MPFIDNTWKPNRKQEIFLSLPWSIKEALFGGGAGSGKSELLLMYAIANKWHENSRFKQVFLRRTYPEIRNEILPRSREIYPKFGATFNKSDMCWTFPRLDQFGGQGLSNDGALLFMGHCETEDDVHKYDSMEINLFTPDEITSLTEWIYLYIGFTRVRSSIPELPAIIRAAGMPGGIGHTFTQKRFVNPCKEGGKIIVGRGGIKRIYIHATLADNQYGDKNYSQSLDAMPEAERQAKKFGSWDAYQGQVFDEFRAKHYPDEPENALHVVKPYEIPKYYPRIVAIDWGFTAYTAVGYAAITPNHRILMYREQAFLKEKIEEWAPKVKPYLDEDNPESIIICQSAVQNRGQEQNILEQVSQALNRPLDISPKDRVSGKMLLHEYLRWRSKTLVGKVTEKYDQDRANWILRNKNIQAYQDYLNKFIVEAPEANIPKILFFDTCLMTIQAIQACTYDKTHPEDVAEFVGDDFYDMLRSILHAAERYFGVSTTAEEKMQQKDKVIHELERTQDMTAFYRNMRKLDSVEFQKPVSRYRQRNGFYGAH